MKSFQIISGEPEDVSLGRPRTAQGSQPECHIRAERSFDAENLPRCLQACKDSDEDDEVRVSLQRSAGPLEILGGREVDRLGELNDSILREPDHELFAEVLPRRPEIAEVPASVDQDRATADAAFEGASPERDAVGGVRDIDPEIVEDGARSDPDGAVADVRVVGKSTSAQGRSRGIRAPRVVSIATRSCARSSKSVNWRRPAA